MGKKSSQSLPTKTSKHEKKPQLNNLMKIMRPKVYITDTFNFKNLVQELTGNGHTPPLESSPPPSWEVEVPFIENYDQYFNQYNLVYQENTSSCVDVSFGGSSGFTTSVEASPDNLNREMGESEKMEFYRGLESMLMEMDSTSSDYDACCDEMFQLDQVCLYDYDLSNFV